MGSLALLGAFRRLGGGVFHGGGSSRAFPGGVSEGGGGGGPSGSRPVAARHADDFPKGEAPLMHWPGGRDRGAGPQLNSWLRPN